MPKTAFMNMPNSTRGTVQYFLEVNFQDGIFYCFAFRSFLQSTTWQYVLDDEQKAIEEGADPSCMFVIMGG